MTENNNNLEVLQPGKSAVSVRLGIAPQTLDEAWRLAQNMARSTLVPKDFYDAPHDVLVAIQLGMEVGLPPMQSLQSIAVINGRPSIWGDGFLALIMASEKYEDHDEYYEVDGKRQPGFTAKDWANEDNAAVCSFQRRGKATPIVQRFTVGMAKKAGLLGKKGPWETYPDRMLKMRARSWAGRDGFPDVLRGLTTAEEAGDIPTVEPVPMRVVPMAAPQRLSASTASAPQPQGAAPAPPATAPVEVDRSRVEPSEKGDSAPASAVTSAGVLIADVKVIKAESGQSAIIIDEHGVQYGSDDRGVILAAVTAKEKGYRMEILAVRKGDISVIEEINRVQQTEAVGK